MENWQEALRKIYISKEQREISKSSALRKGMSGAWRNEEKCLRPPQPRGDKCLFA
jgi:hypothetical protein